MNLATTENLRARAKSIFDCAVAAADPAEALKRTLVTHPLPIPAEGGRTFLISIGKAAPEMLREALPHVVGERQALLVTHYGNQADVPGVEIIRSSHPLPDANGILAGNRVLELLETTRPPDQVIVLISGGGSALLPAPVPGVTLEDKIALNQLLLSAGLDITEMNLVRQQVSRLKGGGLARLAAPAPVTAYILSDVIGDDLRVVASGPTAAAIGSPVDAMHVLKKSNLANRVPSSILAALGSSQEEGSRNSIVVNHLIGSNKLSLSAAKRAAEKYCAVKVVSDQLIGDVATAAQGILHAGRSILSQSPAALLFGGETTVDVRGTGLGGRNQELALRVAIIADSLPLNRDWVLLSGGTDGRDGPTDAAGGIVDAETVSRIRARGQDPLALLENNDSYAALKSSGDLLVTGATGTNVADVQILLLSASG